MSEANGRPAALVTGVSRGIGRAIATRLAADGYHVVGVSRSAPENFEGTYRALDLSAPDAKAQLFEIAAEFKPSRVVANAGISAGGPIEDVSDDEFADVMRTNVQSVLWTMQAGLPAMKANSFGRIVVIGSRASLGKAERVPYAASKSALSGMVRTAALELGRHGITVNIVAPGPIDTEMFAKHQPEGSPAREKIVSTMPVGRMGLPEEVADAVAYFCGDKAGFTTGQSLFVCGGLSVGAGA
jgi:3-oxoacyl-[acyl-carrier protein] reductase